MSAGPGIQAVEDRAALRLRVGRGAGLLLGAVAGLGLPLFVSDYAVFVLATAGVTAFATVSLNLLVGYTGQVSIGHASLVAVGAYTSSFVTVKLGWPFPAALLAAGLAAGLVGLLLGIPCLRLAGPYLAVATLAFGWVVPEILLKWSSVTGGYSGLAVPAPRIFSVTLDSSRKLYYVVLVLLVGLMWMLRNLLMSRIGRAFITLRDSEVAAQAMGIWVPAYKILAFVISAVIAGIGGSLYSHVVGAVTPFEFGFWISVFYLVAVIIGGVGSLPGSVLGALFITLVPEFTAGMRNLPLVLYGSLLIVVTLAFPTGLAGLAGVAVDALRARGAR